jgi:hypothetical protein
VHHRQCSAPPHRCRTAWRGNSSRHAQPAGGVRPVGHLLPGTALLLRAARATDAGGSDCRPRRAAGRLPPAAAPPSKGSAGSTCMLHADWALLSLKVHHGHTNLAFSTDMTCCRKHQRPWNASGWCGCAAAADVHAYILARWRGAGPAELLGHCFPGTCGSQKQRVFELLLIGNRVQRSRAGPHALRFAKCSCMRATKVFTLAVHNHSCKQH